MRELRPFFQGEIDALRVEPDGRVVGSTAAETPHALLPGSFNPLHAGHWGLAAAAERLLNEPVAFELSVLNVDKPPLDIKVVQRRLVQFARRATVWLTRAPTFVDKARLFPRKAFILGADTAERLVTARYYPQGESGVRAALAALREQHCRFLVAGRVDRDGVWHTVDDIPIPDEFRTLFTAIPRSEFQVDISSTELRGVRNH